MVVWMGKGSRFPSRGGIRPSWRPCSCQEQPDRSRERLLPCAGRERELMSCPEPAVPGRG